MVAVAKDEKYAVKCITREEQLATATAAATPKPTAPVASGGPYQGGGARPKCDLCSLLGLGFDQHPREKCFIDPKSSMFRPEVR